MLNYLEQGYVLYIMAAIAALGIIAKLTANHLYKGLLHQAENLANARDRQLQQMKTKYESLWRLNDGVRNTSVFVEKQLHQYRVLGIRMKYWNLAAAYAAYLCFFLGVLTAFLIYQMNGEIAEIIRNLTMGTVLALGLGLFHVLTDGGEREESLENYLCHYLENVMTVRIPFREREEAKQEVREKSGMQDDFFMKQGERTTKDAGELAGQEAPREKALLKPGTRARRNRTAELEALKDSLTQIAAAREDHSGQTSMKKLTPHEEELIDEILQKFLS